MAKQHESPSYVTYVERLIILVQQQDWRAVQRPSSSPVTPLAS
jgi:hypothetical protein